MSIEGEAVVHIAPNGGLTVGAGGITGATKDNLKLQAGTEGATKGQTGYLRISPEYTGAMPEATVEMYSTAYTDYTLGATASMNMQYIGYPIAESIKAKNVIAGWIYNWSEGNGEWQNNRKRLILEPFTGYATTQDYEEDGLLIEFNGHLHDNTAVDIPLTYTDASAMPGWNLLANSFAAPIDIQRMQADLAAGIDATIYLFNTGNTSAVDGEAGTYIAIPMGLAGTDYAGGTYPSVIPAMQGFFVKTTANASLRIDYTKVVWAANYGVTGNTAMRVNKRANQSEMEALSITLETSGQLSKMQILEREDFSTDYENGYDAHYMPAGGFNIFAVEGDEHLAVDATNSIIGTRVGVRTGSEEAYTMMLNYTGSKNNLVLWDIEAEEKVEIREGGMYTFFAEPNSEITGRFIIIEAEAPEIATGVEEASSEGGTKVHKFIKDDKLYILKNGVLYDATGMRVR